MKNHFVIKIARGFEKVLPDDIPYWKDLIYNKSIAVESFYPEFDQLFNRYQFKFWVTREYKPQFLDWSIEEVQAELNLQYRIILQQDYQIPPDFINKLRTVPRIVEASELKVVETELPDRRIATQTSYEPKKAAELIYLKYAQMLTKGTPSVKIAVLDTGINLNHRELAGKLVDAADFVNIQGLDTTSFIGDLTDNDEMPEDEVGHGTHVAGIIAARGVEMDEGVCPNCRIMPVRVLATMKNGNKIMGAGIVDNINTGIKWAVDKEADIINVSLGIKNAGGGLPHEDVIKYAISKNVTIVAASGNDGSPEKYYPGALPGVIAVGAVDNSGNVTDFSSYGAAITVVAPGMNIYSSFSNNTYSFATGTSQASPFVAGSIGLMKSYARQKGKNLSNDTIKYILQHTSDKVDNQFRNQKAGYGLINLADAFKLLNYFIH